MALPDFANDARLDPRVRRVLPILSRPNPTRDVADRAEALARAATPEAIAAYEAATAASDRIDREEVAPSAGLVSRELEFTSEPDGNTVKINFIRPEGDEVVPGVYYIHGGGMMNNSAFDGNYRAWGKLLAARGLAVAMVDFRNSLVASTAPEVEPYPAGLDDCVAGLRWVSSNAAELGIDADRLIVSGDSGGGNLALATGLRLVAAGDAGLVSGIYVFCPYIAGRWPQDELPSSIENEGYFIRLHSNVGAMAYGIEALEAEDPQAWPLFASADELAGYPPTIISVNECDPLRDDGIAFYRKLIAAGVPARCRQIMGTMHAVELIPNVCPDISRDAARDVAGFAYEG